MNNQEKAILVVSFGTSHEGTRKKTIGAIERELAEAYPDWQVCRAFTSGMILRVLERRDDIHVDSVAQAMERLSKDGIKTLLVQPTHIINGEEYEKMRGEIAPYIEKFDQVKIGEPLLSSSKDFEEVVEAFADQVPQRETKEALVFMGHGTKHHADAVYAALDYRFKERGYENVFVGTVEGYPTVEEVKKQVRKYGAKKVVLLPFMIVAGDHATKDMAGDEEDSWQKQFLQEGYEVECKIKGIGELPAIRKIYLEHVQRALANA